MTRSNWVGGCSQPAKNDGRSPCEDCRSEWGCLIDADFRTIDSRGLAPRVRLLVVLVVLVAVEAFIAVVLIRAFS